MKKYIETHEYFNIIKFLTNKEPTIWANNMICLSIIQKLIKGFLSSVQKKEKLNFDWQAERQIKKRDKITKKIKEIEKGFFILLTETELSLLQTYYQFVDMDLNLISSQNIETEIVEMVNENFFNLITQI